VTFRQKPAGKSWVPARGSWKTVELGSKNTVSVSDGWLCLGSGRFSSVDSDTVFPFPSSERFPIFLTGTGPYRLIYVVLSFLACAKINLHSFTWVNISKASICKKININSIIS
jgi:hypothetical protein